jgi:hypothetical protein
MGLSNIHVEGYHIHWDDSFDEFALKYLENGIYPDHNGSNYSIFTAHINKGGEEAHLQFIDCDFNIFERQLLEGADSIKQETLKILRNKDSKVINILIDPESPNNYNFGDGKDSLFICQEDVILRLLYSLDVHVLWKSVNKINVIITKCDKINSKNLGPRILADKKNKFQLDFSLIEEFLDGRYMSVWCKLKEICKNNRINSELFFYSIGVSVLADRYRYSDKYAKIIMQSILTDITFSKVGIVSRFIDFICKR